MLGLLDTCSYWLRRNWVWSNSPQAWVERLTGLGLAAGGCALWAWGERLSLPWQVLLGGLWLLVLAILLRRGWIRLFGPVFFYDLLRISRRARHITVRSLYVVFLLVLLGFTYLFWLASSGLSLAETFFGASLPAGVMGNFALTFFIEFLAVQFLAVFLLTPAYVAGVLAEEKDRGTLDGLLASDLRNREVVLGLLASRVANLGMVLLAGLPVLSAIQFLGGVEAGLVLAGFAFLALTAAALAGIGILCSLYARRPRQAVLRTYLLFGGYLVLSGLSWLLLMPQLKLANFPSTDNWTSPVMVLDLVEWFNVGNLGSVVVYLINGVRSGETLDRLIPPLLRSYAWFHGLLVLACCVWTTWRLRAVALQTESSVGKRGRRRSVSGHKGLFLLPVPPVGNWPLLWKELHIDGGAYRGPLGWLGRGLVLALLFWPALQVMHTYGRLLPASETERLAQLLGFWCRAIGALLGFAALFQVATHAAGSISGERDRQTLDGLLATPLSNRQILFSKWLGSILSVRGVFAALVLVLGVGLVTHGLHPFGIAAFLAAWLVYAAFTASLGLWFSLYGRTGHRATFWTLFALTMISIMWLLLVHDLTDLVLTYREAWSLLPPFTLYHLTFSPFDLRRDVQAGTADVPLGPMLAGLAFWGVLAAGLWGLTSRRFRREFHRDPGTSSLQVTGIATTPAGTVSRPAVRLPVRNGLALWRRRALYVLAVFLPLGLLAGYFLRLHWLAEAQLRDAIAETDRLDPGWRLEELEARRKVLPEDRNSALLVLRVLQQLPSDEVWPSEEYTKAVENLAPERQLSPVQTQVLRKELDRVGPAAVAEARRLADLPEGRFPLSWPAEAPYPELSQTQSCRRVAHLLVLDVMQRAQEGDGDGALASCRALLNISRAIGDEPALLAMQVRVALRSMAALQVERVLAQARPSEPALRVLQELIEEDTLAPLLLIGLRGERAGTNRLLERISQQRGNAGTVFGIPGSSKNKPLWPRGEELAMLAAGSLQAQRAALLRLQSEYVEVAKLPDDQQPAALALLNQRRQGEPWLVWILIPPVDRTAQSFRRNRALLCATAVALALERYRLRHGRWPATLHALVPEQLRSIPVDPVDGQPLRYRVLPDGVVVYSLGVDGADNGGTIDRRQPDRPETDVGVRLWNVERRRQPPPVEPKKTQ